MPRLLLAPLALSLALVLCSDPVEAQEANRAAVAVTLSVAPAAHAEFDPERGSDAPTVAGMKQPIIDLVRDSSPVPAPGEPARPAGAPTAPAPQGGPVAPTRERMVWIISPTA